MTLLFENKAALVTGGGSGIGRATALAFAREGAAVIVSDILEDNGRETVSLIEQAGGQARFIRADMRRMDEVDALVVGAAAAFGRLDCAFNNAGHQGRGGDAVTCSEDEWDMVMDINLKSVWRCMQREIPHLLAQGGGAIVNTSSGLGLAAAPNMMAYITSKHAVVGLTKSAALDYADRNIRVNVLHPGPTESPTLAAAAALRGAKSQDLAPGVPMKRIGTPEDQAEAVIYLCSDRAAFVTGASLVVDGGVTVRR